MPGPAPKPAHLRQRRNKKSGAAELEAPKNAEIPEIPNPNGRLWHELTVTWWKHVWESPMATQYLPTDVDGLGRVAVLIDAYYLSPRADLMSEIRLQEARFGLSPLDRSRLQWEIARADEAGRTKKPVPTKKPNTKVIDPRKALRAV